MPSNEPLFRRWTWLWRVWLVAGILFEFYALWRGRLPLTGHARGRILNRKTGSALGGAFFVWMIWHWLFDTAGLDHIDLIAVVSGALLGLAGYLYRMK
jgi:hypothetical protein